VTGVFESRFCKFEAPPGWLVLPRVGVLENHPAGPQRSAVVMENWLDAPERASDFASRQVAILEQEAPGLEVLRRGAAALRGVSDGFSIWLRSRASDGTRLLQELVAAVEGPLAVSLVLTAPESDGPAWQRIFGGVLGSFSIPAAEWSRAIARGGIIVPAERSPERTQKVPGLQIVVPVPPGWTFDAQAACLRSPSGAVLSGQRGGLPSLAPDELFCEALSRLQSDASARIRRWDRGELPGGRSFFALEALSGSTGTWTKTGGRLVREVFVQDEGLIAFRLSSDEADSGAVSGLFAVVSGYEMLPPAERMLTVDEGWWKAELPGAWLAGGGGVYVLPSAPARVVAAQKAPLALPLKEFADHAIRQVRNAPDFVETIRDERRDVSVRGVTGVQFFFDYVSQEGSRTATRSLWAEGSGSLYGLSVRGPVGPETDDLFARVIAGVDAAAVRQGR
jgi:hypothetical protein